MANNTFTDPRDGKVYPYKRMEDGKLWTTQNLAFNAGDGSWNVVRSLERETIKWGFLYNWEAAQRAVPDGWKIPVSDEWQTLFDAYGDSAGQLIKGGSSGLEIVFSGVYIPSDHTNHNDYETGTYWASNSLTGDGQIASYLFEKDVENIRCYTSGNNYGNAIRLIKIE